MKKKHIESNLMLAKPVMLVEYHVLKLGQIGSLCVSKNIDAVFRGRIFYFFFFALFPKQQAKREANPLRSKTVL